MMEYRKKHFDPQKGAAADGNDAESVPVGQGTEPGDVYVYTPTTILALNVALSTRRPLLVTGEPGSGKTTLAQNAARVLGWWFYRETVTSRTQATDLFYSFDALRRLNDANIPNLPLQPTELYVDPGVLWWAFEPESAARRGKADLPADAWAASPGIAPRETEDETGSDNAVVLIDEIDKADPDVPNDLLEAVDSGRFLVRETGKPIQAPMGRRILMVLTSNGERDLPPAFLRRCITLTLPPPTEDFFALVADKRFGEANSQKHRVIAAEVTRAREAAQKRGMRMPSTAEFLDAVQACLDLDVTLGEEATSEVWKAITGSVLLKTDRF
jgi:MoxR-like ATPase